MSSGNISSSINTSSPSSSGSSSSSELPSSSGSLSSSGSPLRENALDKAWLKAHSRRINALKSSLVPERVVEISDSSITGEDVEDVASTYHAKDMGDTEEGEGDLYEFTTGLGLDEAGPSRLGVGKGKSLEQYK